MRITNLIVGYLLKCRTKIIDLPVDKRISGSEIIYINQIINIQYILQ